MRIGFLCPYELPVPAVQGGAVETLVELFLQNNETKKLDITVYSIDTPEARIASKQYPNTKFVWNRYHNDPKYEKLNAVFRRLGLKKRYHAAVAKLDRKMLNEIDVMIVENCTPALIPLRKKFKGKIYLHSHSDSIASGVNKDAQAQMDACDGVISVSYFIDSRIAPFLESKKRSVLWNAIDLKAFDVRKRNSEMPNGLIRIGYVGRIVRAKGVDLLVDAFLKLHETYGRERVQLRLIGSTAFQNSTADEYVNRISQKLNSAKDVNYIQTGYVDHAKIPDELAQCDIVVAPSQCNEALPLAVAEAMAMGCKVIASDIGGIPEVLGNEHRQDLIPVDEHFVDSLYDRLVAYVETPQLILKDRAKSVERIQRLFNSTVYLDGLVEIISD